MQKCRSSEGAIDLGKLLELVDRSYQATDSERRLRDRALDELQLEIEEIHGRIRRESEASFNAVMDNVGEGVVVINDQGLIENFNKAACSIFGYELEEIVGKNVKVLMREEEAVKHDDFLRNYLTTGEAKIIGAVRETFGRRKNGEIFPLDLVVGELHGSSRRRYLGTIRDISVRKKAESELRLSESRFRDLAGSASDWFWETDSSYKLTFVSERIGVILGVKPAALLGHDHFELGLEDNDPSLAEQHRSDIAARLPFRELVFHVGPVAGKDSKTVRISGLPVFDEQGEFIGYRGMGADITREMEAEGRARQAQQRLVDAMESINDGIAVYDHDDRLVACNSEYKRFYLDAADLIATGMTFEQVLLSGAYVKVIDAKPDQLQDWLIERLKHHREASGKPLICKTIDGRWVQSRTYLTSDGGLVNIRSDVTQLKLREQELDALRHRYALILDAADEGIIGLDRQGQITFANRVAGQMLGLRSEDMTGKCFLEIVQPFYDDSRPCMHADSPIARTLQEGASNKSEDELFWRRDNTNFHAEYLAAPIFDEGVVSGAVVIFRDVTLKLAFDRALTDHQRLLEKQVEERTSKLIDEVRERTRTEAALRASQVRLKNISDSLFESILVIGESGHVEFANHSAKRTLSTSDVLEELEGRHIDSIFMMRHDGQVVPFDKTPWKSVIQSNETVRNDDALFVMSEDQSIQVAYACSPLAAEHDGRSVILSFRDIAQLKHAQREALHASRLASVGELAAGIAHEINTPIQYIGDNLRFIGNSVTDIASALARARSFADTASAYPECSVLAVEFQGLLDKMDVDYLLSETPTAVKQSLDGVAQVARIVLSMKEFSHPGSGIKTMSDINRAIENTLVVSRNTWKHVAEMDWRPDPNLPLVACLPGEMNQVFLNIVVNAAHAIEGSGKALPGKITISTSKLNDETVEIRISDTGTGVPEEIRDRIFDPFFTTKGVGKGTGQGLAISRDVVVTKHGGQLILEDSGDDGATFVIRLPVNDPEGIRKVGYAL